MKHVCIIVLTFGMVLFANNPGWAQSGTAFTYQGKLADNGSAANGSYDLEFKLYDAATLGAQIAGAVTLENVDVYDGYFTVTLDFGPSAFNGAARWLQIAVRPGASTGGFTTLNPRQKITPTPYALQTKGITVDDANNVGLGAVNPIVKLNVLGPDVFAIYGTHQGTGNYGYLGSSDYGVAGRVSTDYSYGVYGHSTKPTSAGVQGYGGYGNYGNLGAEDYGVFGKHYSSGNRGNVGTSTAGIYGYSTSGYAGHFEGKSFFDGPVGIGAPPGNSRLEITGHNTQANIYVTDYSSTAIKGPSLALRKARGTTVAPLAVLSGDILGRFEGQGHDGANFYFGGFMDAVATQNWSPAAHGAALTFYTVPNSQTTAYERMRIDQNGNVGIGVNPTVRLDVQGRLRVQSAESQPLVELNNTDSGITLLSTSAANYGVKGQSSNISFAGVAGFNTTSGQGLYGSSAGGWSVYAWNSATGYVGALGGNNYAGYFSGPAYFSEKVGIGATSPSEELEVAGDVKLNKNEGALILRTPTRNDPGRYSIRFQNNSLAPFLGDETQDQYFEFYTDFVKTRNYSAHVRVHGLAANSWNTYLELTHDGTDGIIKTDLGDIVLQPAGNVGVGTASPSAKLEVAGNTHIEGNLTWKAKTSYISVPASAFQPVEDGYQYRNLAGFLKNYDGASPWYNAPLQLPHGATLQKITFIWQDTSAAENAYVELKYHNYPYEISGRQMAILYSSGSPGNGATSTTTITNPLIDNTYTTYELIGYLPSTLTLLYSVIIEYTISAPY